MSAQKSKILILSAPVGNGHNAAGKAIKLFLERDHQADVKIHDVFLTTSRFRTWWFSKFYFWNVKYFFASSTRYYRKLKAQSVKNKTPGPSPGILVGGKVKPVIAGMVKDFAPDAVICTHIAGAVAASDLKKAGKLTAPVFNITTDYAIPPYIEYCGLVDYFVTPSADFEQELLDHGIKPEQILPYGIPTDPRFSIPLDKVAIRRELNLKEDLFTVVMANGFVGVGNTLEMIDKIFTALPDKVQIISICGKNDNLKKQIDNSIKKGRKNLLNYGFVHDFDKIISAADLFIGKLGGLTTTETLNKGVCILAVTNLPMQEHDNMLYLSSYGVCDYIKNPAQVGTMVAKYVENPEILSCMRANIENFKKPDAAANIAQTVMRVIRGKMI